MNKSLSRFALVIGTMMVILANAVWWIGHPDAARGFSHPVWNWLVGVCGAKTGAQQTDLAFFISSLSMLVVLLAALKIHGRARRRGGRA